MQFSVANEASISSPALLIFSEAVERNLAIVPRSRYGETVLSPGDRIEIVQFVGGG